MNNNAALEALLFVNGDPLSRAVIAKTLEISKNDTDTIVENLQQSYEQDESRGLRLIIHDDEIQLVTHPRVSDTIEILRESTLREALTPAALETLAVISYRGPLPKSEIESIRGVNCGSIMRTLLLRGLIKRERDSNDRRMFLYRITSEFIKALGLSSIQGLPEFETLLNTKSQ